MLFSHLFFCLSLLLPLFTVPCRIVIAMPEELEIWPYHLSFRFFAMVRRSSCTPTAFWILLLYPNSIPVHSSMLPSHLFFCLPLLLAPFIVHCRNIFTMLEDLEMWPYHLSFRFFAMVRRSSCTPTAFWILLLYLITHTVATSVICERLLFTLLNFSTHFKRMLNICNKTLIEIVTISFIIMQNRSILYIMKSRLATPPANNGKIRKRPKCEV